MLNKPLKEEILDQALHVLSNFFIVTYLVFLGASLYTAVLISIAYTLGREIYQRLRGGNNWYDCKEGCQRDILFSLLGTILGIIYASVL